MARSLVLEARTPEKFDGFMCKMERRAIELRASLSDNDAVRHGETMETSALDAYKRIMGAYDKPAPTTRTPAKVDSFMREMEKRAIELRALADDEAAQRGETMEASVFDAYKRITSAYDKPASAAAM